MVVQKKTRDIFEYPLLIDGFSKEPGFLRIAIDDLQFFISDKQLQKKGEIIRFRNEQGEEIDASATVLDVASFPVKSVMYAGFIARSQTKFTEEEFATAAFFTEQIMEHLNISNEETPVVCHKIKMFHPSDYGLYPD
jgi:hypothetical protein